MSNAEIDKLAADWFAKVDAGDLAPEERRMLDSWLAADPRHLGAFARHAAAVASLDPLCAIGSDEVRKRCAETSPPLWTRRRFAVAGGGATALAAAAGFTGLVLWKRNGQVPPTTRRQSSIAVGADYATDIGTTRVVALPDGSIVTLNTDSRVTVKFTEHLREVRLFQGEALFTVAKNKARPFVVVAGDTQVRAVGTAFAVRYTQKQPIRILVQEGVVVVTRAGKVDAKPVLAVADTQTLVPRNAPITTRPVTYSQLTGGIAWQYGQIFFDNDTLEDAAQEFARYSNTKIIVDPAVANRTVTGLFPSDNPVGFAKAAATVHDLHVTVGVEEVRIAK